MDFIKKNSVALVALVIAILGLFTPAGQQVVKEVQSLGGITNYDAITLDKGSLTISTAGQGTTYPGGADVTDASASLSSTASTTPCAIANPFSATSTLVGFLLNITTSTSTGGTLVYDVGVASTAFATTTIISGGNTLAQGAQGNYSATSSPTVGVGQYVVVKFNPAFAGTAFGPILGGTCTGLFMEN
ncbi:MAG: hypothetical protein V4438_04220 [Patescibacteria group bacterium]